MFQQAIMNKLEISEMQTNRGYKELNGNFRTLNSKYNTIT